MVRRKIRTSPAPSSSPVPSAAPGTVRSNVPRSNRVLPVLAGLVGIAAVLSGAGWWYVSSRPTHSAAGIDLGRPVGGVGPDGLNLLVITLDTARADRIGAYGAGDVETPVIDRLAREGVLFEQTTAPAPLTLPAHCSIFTGRYPAEHGVRDNGGFFLGAEQTTLARLLRAKGFSTGAVVGAYVLDGKWGLNQGFDAYVDDFDLSTEEGMSLASVQRRGDEVVDRALPWLERVQGRRFFAWLHFYDPHTPYDPPEPFRTRYGKHPYNGEIAFVDAQVGRLVAFLERRRLLDRTIVVVLGDHGESLGDHGEESHGFFIYESTVRVPFVIRAPFTATMGGRHVTDPVRSIDLLPTLLDLLGQPAPGDVSGTSLVPLMTGTRRSLDLEGFAEGMYPLHHFGWSELKSLRSGRFKVIDAPRPELYDLESDPRETTNLFESRRSVADPMLARLRQLDTTLSRRAPTQGAADVDPEVRARLAALGYVGSFVATASSPRTGRADPKDKIDIFNRMNHAWDRSKTPTADSFEKTSGLLQSVVDSDPTVTDAWFLLGTEYSRAGRPRESIAFFKRALALKPDYDLAIFNMAHAYMKMGQEDAALAGFEHYLTVDPKNAYVWYEVGEIFMARGDLETAGKKFATALAIDPKVASARNAIGVLAFQRGDLATAEREIRAALEAKPTVRLAHYNLALMAEARDDLATAEAEYKKELALHPYAFKAAFNLGRLYERTGNRPAQIAALEQSIAQADTFAEGRIFLAKAYLDAGTNFSKAVDLAREGLALKPAPEVEALAHLVLADLYNRLGRPQDAAREVAAARRR
jgi:choline-sulfatase